MRKRDLFLVCFLIFVVYSSNFSKTEFFKITNASLNNFNLVINKKDFFSDEIIRVNASWILYNLNGEYSYIQIRLMNSSNEILWKSSKFEENGHINKNFSIKIKDLYLNFDNFNRYPVFLLFYYYIYEISGQVSCLYLKNITINIEEKNEDDFKQNILFTTFLSMIFILVIFVISSILIKKFLNKKRKNLQEIIIEF